MFADKGSAPLGRISALSLSPLQAIQNFFILKLLGPSTDDVKERLATSVWLSINFPFSSNATKKQGLCEVTYTVSTGWMETRGRN